MQQSITVLMSTYNGGKYLQEQIKSILRQKDVSVRLIIRDDGSTDETLDILRIYQESNPNIVIEPKTNNMGPCKSFLYLISKYNDDEYFALADQDDIWDEDKLTTAINKIQELGASGKPVLYYSNLRIVDAEGTFCRLSHNAPHTAKRRFAAFVENLATGCTVVYNKNLADIAHNIRPDDYSMHDAWLYTVTKLFGSVIYDFAPHINYRQHGANQVGTYKNKVDLKKIHQELEIVLGKNGKMWSKNAALILNQFQAKLSPMDIDKIRKIAEYEKSLKAKISVLIDKDYYPDSFYRKIRFIAELLCNTL